MGGLCEIENYHLQEIGSWIIWLVYCQNTKFVALRKLSSFCLLVTWTWNLGLDGELKKENIRKWIGRIITNGMINIYIIIIWLIFSI